jgi:fatty acid desaturase
MNSDIVINTSGVDTETNQEIISDKQGIAAEPVRNLAYYNRKLAPYLPEEIFERTPYRTLYAAAFLGLNVLLISAVLFLPLHWSLKILAGVLIGQFNAGLAFISHETSHGQHITNKNAQDFLVLFAFSPFMISPTYWRFWHNRLHHGNTQYILRDPDAFPNTTVYRGSKFMRYLYDWTPGSKTIRSYFYFFFWFSFQSFLNQIYMRFGNKMWEQMKHNRVSLEFAFQISLVASYIFFVGSQAPVYLILIPFTIQNYTVMSYISTNHNMSPLTKINDPLENSLSVTVHPWLEKLHLNFGYHVEHHIFPRMSGAHAKTVHYELLHQFPETYQVMPKSKALTLLYKTPRLYKNPKTLINPKTNEQFSTLPKIEKQN